MATVPAWAKPIIDKQDEHENRIAKLEQIATDLEEIKSSIASVARWIKGAVPTIVGAAVAAGMVNGKLGAFLNALFVGH